MREVNGYLWNWAGPNYIEVYRAGRMRTDPALPFSRSPGEMLGDADYFDAVTGLALAYINILRLQEAYLDEVRAVRSRTEAMLLNEEGR